ncbi:MAG TPA: NADH-ubiquinone oxidoreductase-F iron-sulfur binding region domain-containing protein [Acidimicrobiales bacterium]|nr:NADH-ubiquinone oxidoreductase-F iron-sulfur binding region domain-containing protein [Acidimicrobiales bacterium]
MTEPRLITTRVGDPEGHTLERYLATGGYTALRTALGMSPDEIHAQVKASGILGRGGAEFPAHIKWRTTMDLPQPHYLVVNADEGEPSTFKDHMLIERDPHQLIEGMAIAAFAVQAHVAFVYLRGEFALGFERLQTALNEAYEHGAVGRNILGSDFSLDIVLHPGAGAYICGEETALLESLEGKRGFPRIKIVPTVVPATIGVYSKPTVLNNVETLSNLPWIIANGGDAFAGLGENISTGTRLFSLSGHVEKPGNYEVEMVKTTYRDLIDGYGGGVLGGRQLKFIIPGGVSSAWFGPQHLDVPLGRQEVGAADGVMPGGGGTMLGSGSVIVADDTTCPVRIAWRIAKFFAHESCGQCTPCREGTGWLEKAVWRIENGDGRPADLDLLLDVSDNIAPGLSWPYPMTTICFLGPSSAVAVVSALSMFRDDFEAHIELGRCPHD